MPRSGFSLLGWVIVVDGRVAGTGGRRPTRKIYRSEAQAESMARSAGIVGYRVIAAYGIRDEMDSTRPAEPPESPVRPVTFDDSCYDCGANGHTYCGRG